MKPSPSIDRTSLSSRLGADVFVAARLSVWSSTSDNRGASPRAKARSYALGPVLSFLVRLPALLLLLLVAVYQRTLSPILPVVFGPNCGCRFSPTCSHYAAEALREHGALAGMWLALRRLIKCTPLLPGGFDPVPMRRERSTPICVRVAS